MKLILFILLCLPTISLAQNKVEEGQLKYGIYKLNQLIFDVAETDIRAILIKDVKNNSLKKGQLLDRKVFENECNRIEKVIAPYAYPPFSKRQVTYTVDTLSEYSYNLKIIVKGIDENKIY